ncbi:MAG: TolC family protein [Thermodesulfobacteriota bacterium]
MSTVRQPFPYVAVFIFWISVAPAVPANAAFLSLNHAIQEAIQHNPQTAASLAVIEQAEHQVQQARSGYHPQLFLSETLSNTNNPMWAFGTKLNQERIQLEDFVPDRLNNPSSITNSATVLGLEWPLYTGGQVGLRIDQANIQVQGATRQAERVRQQLIARTVSAYSQVVLAKANLQVIEDAIRTAKAYRDMIETRYRSGLVVKSDALRAQVRVAELEQERIQAESRIQVAQAMLNSILGRAVDESFDVSDILHSPKPLCLESVESWEQKALQRRPDLAAIRLKQQMAEKEVARSKAEHLPQIAMIGNYEINSETFDDTATNYTIGAMMKVNLYSGQRITAKTREAEAAVRQIAALKQEMESAVQVEARQAYLRLTSSYHRIAVAEKAVDQAKEGLKIVQDRYENGLYPLVSLLDAELALKQARTAHLQALHEYLNAGAELALASGEIDESFDPTDRSDQRDSVADPSRDRAEASRSQGSVMLKGEIP